MISSVLVAGDGLAAGASAIAFALRGLDVTLVGRGPKWNPASEVAMTMDVTRMLHDAGLAGEPADARTMLSLRFRELTVDERLDTELVGSISVDRHVEAELSDGRIENYDVIVGVDGDEVCVVTGGGVAQTEAVAVIARTLVERS